MIEGLALRFRQLDANFYFVGAAQLSHGQGAEEGVPYLLPHLSSGQPQLAAFRQQYEVDLSLAAVVIIRDIPGGVESLHARHEGLAGSFQHGDVGVAEVHGDVLTVAAGTTLGFEGDLVHAGDVADLVAPELDHLLGTHLALVRRFHDDLHVDEVLVAHVGLYAFGDAVKVVGVDHALGGGGYGVGHGSGLVRRGAHRQRHAGFDLVGGLRGHEHHAHVTAVAITADHQ